MAVLQYETGGDLLAKQICPALGLDYSQVRRIILDLKPGDIVVAYVEMIADKRILDVNWELAKGAVISRGK